MSKNLKRKNLYLDLRQRECWRSEMKVERVGNFSQLPFSLLHPPLPPLLLKPRYIKVNNEVKASVQGGGYFSYSIQSCAIFILAILHSYDWNGHYAFLMVCDLPKVLVESHLSSQFQASSLWTSDIRSGSIYHFALSCPELLLSDEWCHSGVEDISSVSLSHSLVKSQSYVANLRSRCLSFLFCHFVVVFVLHRLLEEAAGTCLMVAALCLCLLFAAFLCIFCLCLADLVGRGCRLGCCYLGRPSARWNLGRGAPSRWGRLSFNFNYKLEILAQEKRRKIFEEKMFGPRTRRRRRERKARQIWRR